MTKKKLKKYMKVLHINQSDTAGGAARAAYRIHKMIINNGIKDNILSEMRVVIKNSNDESVFSNISGKISFLKFKIIILLNKIYRLNFKTLNKVSHSTALFQTNIIKKINSHFVRKSKGIVHLHWLGDNTISIEEINKINYPIVWTLHDQWPFCGAEHYTHLSLDTDFELIDKRYIEGYKSSNRPTHENGIDINKRTWIRKKRSWRKNMYIVCPSNWMAKCVRESALMRDFQVKVIPYPIDLNFWKPVSKAKSRKIYNLPERGIIILFGAIGGTLDKRKGADLLLNALEILACEFSSKELKKLNFVVFGQDPPIHKSSKYKFPIHFVGKIDNDEMLRYLYSTADLFVIPSRQDNLPQTAIESHACGIPVVGFQTGGLIDIIDENITGLLAKPFEAKSLAKSIKYLLKDKNRLQNMAIEARKRAERLWSEDVIYRKYLDIYKNI